VVLSAEKIWDDDYCYNPNNIIRDKLKNLINKA